MLDALRSKDKTLIAANPDGEIDYFETVLNKEYYIPNLLSYQHYLIKVQSIEGTEVQNINMNTGREWQNSKLNKLRFETKIECNLNKNDISCKSIMEQSTPHNSDNPDNSNNFEEKVQKIMQTHLRNNDFLFYIENADSLQIICKDCTDEQHNYLFYAIVGCLALLFVIAGFAFLFNHGKFPKFPGFNYVDNAAWSSLIIYGIQCWDFYSDVALSVEILGRDDLFEKKFILIAGFGSAIFIVMPYITNLVIASRIKKIIKNNPAAKGWFQYYTPIFTVLVVLCGGCHAALTVVASNIFGLKLFSCGLTKYDMKKLNRIRIIASVLIENIPQLACQALYTIALEFAATQAVWFAFIASSLSIIALTLSYMIERDETDTTVAEYYISLEKTPLNATLTDQEKQALMDNKGRTQALGDNIAEVFGIPHKNIEVGCSMITKYGINMHIVHYVYKDDLEMMEEELLYENAAAVIVVTAKYYVSQVFASLAFDINEVFYNHFGLGQNFQVIFHHKFSAQKGLRGVKNSTLDIGAAASNDMSDKRPADPKTFTRRKTVLQTVINRLNQRESMICNTNKRKIKSEAIRAIQEYCQANNIRGKKRQKQSIMKLMDSMNNIESKMMNYAIHGTHDTIDFGTSDLATYYNDILPTNIADTGSKTSIELQEMESIESESFKY